MMKPNTNLKIVVLKGLPASGKTTYAKKLVADNPGRYKRTSKDDLRAMLDSGKFSKPNEEFVLSVRNFVVEEAIKSGVSVIVDDTNLVVKHEDYMRELAEKLGVGFEIKKFGTSLEECIERDSKREKPVGEKVIRDMYKQFYAPKSAPPMEQDDTLRQAYIFDIDGTLAKMNGRAPFDYSRVSTDVVNQKVFELYIYLRQCYDIIIVSGRDGVCRADTLQWLADHDITFTEFHMRPENNHEKDAVIKERIFNEHIKDKYYVMGVFDDRDRVVEMWRKLGLTCFQVDYGDF